MHKKTEIWIFLTFKKSFKKPVSNSNKPLVVDRSVVPAEEEPEPVVEKRARKARREPLPPDELGPMWAPYQSRMVTQKGQVISTPKLILL